MRASCQLANVARGTGSSRWFSSLSAWRAKPLKYVLTRRSIKGKGGARLLSAYRDHGVVPKDSRDDNFNRAGKDLDAYLFVRAGDLVVNKMKAWQGSVAVSGYEGIVSPAYFVFGVDKEVYGRFLHHQLRSTAFVQEFKRVSDGVRPNQWDLDLDEFGRCEARLPAVPTQKAIAEFLDRKSAAIDALIDKKQKLLELLAEKRAALINQAVTKGLDPNVPMKDSGIPWIGKIPAHWEVWSVRSLLQAQKVEIQDGNHGELHPVAAEYVDDGIPFVMANNLRDGRVDLAGCNRITKERADRLRIGFARKGDVLLSHKGTIGSVAVVRELECHPYFMLTPQVTYYRLRGDLLTADYLATWFEGPAFQTDMAFLGSVGSTRAYLGITAQRELSVVVPPRAEQAKTLAFLTPEIRRIDCLAAGQKRSVQCLEEYRQALITAAVTGQLDIGEEAA